MDTISSRQNHQFLRTAPPKLLKATLEYVVTKAEVGTSTNWVFVDEALAT